MGLIVATISFTDEKHEEALKHKLVASDGPEYDTLSVVRGRRRQACLEVRSLLPPLTLVDAYWPFQKWWTFSSCSF